MEESFGLPISKSWGKEKKAQIGRGDKTADYRTAAVAGAKYREDRFISPIVSLSLKCRWWKKKEFELNLYRLYILKVAIATLDFEIVAAAAVAAKGRFFFFSFEGCATPLTQTGSKNIIEVVEEGEEEVEY